MKTVLISFLYFGKKTQCTTYRSNSKQTFPHNELLILPWCALGFVVTSFPIQKTIRHLEWMFIMSQSTGFVQFLQYHSLEATSTYSYYWSPPNMDSVSRRLSTTHQVSAQSPAKWFTVSFRLPDAFHWPEGQFMSACVCVWHTWYGTLTIKGTWKVSVLTGCRFALNSSYGIV